MRYVSAVCQKFELTPKLTIQQSSFQNHRINSIDSDVNICGLIVRHRILNETADAVRRFAPGTGDMSHRRSLHSIDADRSRMPAMQPELFSSSIHQSPCCPLRPDIWSFAQHDCFRLRKNRMPLEKRLRQQDKNHRGQHDRYSRVKPLIENDVLYFGSLRRRNFA